MPADTDLTARFAAELTAADGTPHRGEDPGQVVLDVVGPEAATVALDGDADLDPVAAALTAAGHTVLRPDDPSYRIGLAGAAVGVTRCAAAVADTGSLMLVFDRTHPRSTSLLPRAHVAVVQAADLVASIGEALARIPSPAPSAVTFVTGPSRSADIEQILTLGVHGPARVDVVLP